MPYLGTPSAVGFSKTTKDRFSGDNSTTGFTMSQAAGTGTDIQVFVDNIRQEPTVAYSTSGATLTFTEAPPTGTNNVYVIHQHQALGTGLLPPQDLGSTDYIFGDDISLQSDSAVINFGTDSEITLTHVHNTGLLINSTNQLQFGDSGTYIHQSADGVLDLVSDTEIEINATTIDINGTTNLGGGELVLDSDGDTSLTADTDDVIDIKIAGSDVAGFDASGNFHLGNSGNTNDGAIHTNAGSSAKNIVFEADRASDGQGLGNIQFHSAGTNVAQISGERAASDSSADMVFYTYNNGGSLAERMRMTDDGKVLIGNTAYNSGATGILNNGATGLLFVTADGDAPVKINRLSSDGELVELSQANNKEGSLSVSGSTVSLVGFSGQHESSGIATNTAVGTVVSTIDELDTYASGDKKGQTRADHAKVKVSDSVGDKRVYGVVSRFNADDKVCVASVGVGSIKVTGSCVGGDLLESNGDGTAKVQSDDTIKSSTIGKVTIGNSSASVKLVSCVLYCG